MAGDVLSLPGGIISLVELVVSHGSALDYDLLTLTRYTLDDIGADLSWERLLHFVQHLPATSALVREMEPDMAQWVDGRALADILADMFDLLQSFLGTYVNANSKKKSRRLKPYPRPWLKPTTRHFGSDPIPISEFDKWWKEG